MGAKDAATVPDEHERQGQAYSTGDREQSSLLRSRRMVPKIAYAKNQIKYVIASIAIIAANLKEWFIGHVSSIFVVADRRYYELLFSSFPICVGQRARVTSILSRQMILKRQFPALSSW